MRNRAHSKRIKRPTASTLRCVIAILRLNFTKELLRNQNQSYIIIRRHEDGRLKTFKNIGVLNEKQQVRFTTKLGEEYVINLSNFLLFQKKATSQDTFMA